jgi:hypothetical protein
MRHIAKILVLTALIAVATLSSAMTIVPVNVPTSNNLASGTPLQIRQGPIGVFSAGTGDPYWFQQGAFGDSSTHNSVGASVMIRTVYDSLNNDAHSYWVGAVLSNGAFVQVGYLNGLTTTGQLYCCAWFYEFFPAGNSTSPPIIGPPGSAGPIGSWHTYTLNYTGSGVWSFYMDSQYLGSSTPSSDRFNLGAGSTGSNPVAALSEVAQTNGRSDIIGPGEFKNFEYAPTSPNSFQLVQTGDVHIGCGEAPNSCLPNPYGVAEIEKVQNDFLTGSFIANPCGQASPCGPDECGSANTVLWSLVLDASCPSNNFSFSFVDREGQGIVPPWISLNDSANKQIFYSDYSRYQSLTVPTPSGQWAVSQISWHAVNVATGEIVNMSMTSQVFQTQVFSVTLAVVGYFYSLPVKNGTVILYLPDSTNQTLRTDSNGEGVFTQLPPSTYSIHIGVPYGITSNQVQTITGPGSIVAKVFSLPELITIIIPPIFLAVLASILIVRKERQRQAMIQAQPPMQPMMGPVFCRTCGQPLSPTANFCTSCGTPVRMIVQ